MKILKIFVRRDDFQKIGDVWSFAISIIVFNTVIISFWRQFYYTFIGSNVFWKFIEMNVAFSVYLFLLCGLVAVRSGIQSAISFPLVTLPYIFTPIYALMLSWLNLPRGLAFTIAFIHSLLLSSKHDPVILSVRIFAYSQLFLVVRHWL
ncbi:hypothetical protein [Pseudothermotoga sp.]|uniref:hypothetical protein n=1 Tax=Pseudothermotoga sp. TaxID=2033661 RepID=UPI0031F635DD